MKLIATLIFLGLVLAEVGNAEAEPVPVVHTYADMEAEIARYAARYEESMLAHPAGNFDTT